MKRLLPLVLVLSFALAACDSADDSLEGFDAAAILGTYVGTTAAVAGTDYFAEEDTVVVQQIRVTISEVQSTKTPLLMRMTCTTPAGSEGPGAVYACGELVGYTDAEGAFFYRSYDPAAQANGLRVGRNGQIALRRTGTVGDGVSFVAETTGDLSARRFDLSTTTTYRQGDRTNARRDFFETAKTATE